MGGPDQNQVQIDRLINWNTEVLHKLLKQVVAQRIALGKKEWQEEPILVRDEATTIFDEVADVIDLPAFVFRRPTDPDMIDIPPQAENQLKAFVAAVANAYHSNPFHCLQHASAVTMHLSKLLSRVVATELGGIEEGDEDDENIDDEASSDSSQDNAMGDIASHLHNHTYGIASDPLTQFALVLSAFIHAVDHSGLPNSEVAKEDPETAALYKNRSIIEQRSIDKAWKKLMEPGFYDLRRCIYSDETELKRFRQVVVNSVLSTDIDDAELQSLRMHRWEKTFSSGAYKITREDVNRKATIVLEHLMQASDIFHTMQPWIVYEKWCSRDFEEKYLAFKSGRISEDPSLTWYQNELELFDNYVIPLAMQLKDCDAFVVGSDEYLNFALKNRQQLASKGKNLVPTFLAKLNAGISSETSIGNDDMAETASNTEQDEKAAKHMQRLIQWNVEMLKQLLKQVVARREALGISSLAHVSVPSGGTDSFILDEVAEVIEFPQFDPSVSPDKLNPESITLDPAAEAQLEQFVTDISSRFTQNDFHGVDHGSQVCMMTKKMLSRISTQLSGDQAEHAASDLHNRTFGISSDPLAQFAVVFASLVHHVEHEGVPNSQLVREEHPLAAKYNRRSISEQHSIAVSWEHLMQPQFADLRKCIFSEDSDIMRFRQIVVNCVLATDFVDEDLLALRKHRWEKAFVRGRTDDSTENRNRRATIVLEVIMQASDVFHATQNWHLYHKWNERHFFQAYKAFRSGRLTQDPSIFWYKSELLFFDEHVIPIAKQMSECGVFDSTGDEYLSFALSNRQQWAAKGGDYVASMMARYHGQEIEKGRTKRAFRRISLTASNVTHGASSA